MVLPIKKPRIKATNIIIYAVLSMDENTSFVLFASIGCHCCCVPGNIGGGGGGG